MAPFQGLIVVGDVPRALPWAVLLRAFSPAIAILGLHGGKGLEASALDYVAGFLRYTLPRIMGYFLDKVLFGRKIALGIFMTRFFFAFLGFCVFALAGTALVCYWIFQEINLELQFQRRYGGSWRLEFEHYYGPLSQVHARITVAIVCMFALAAILGWWIRKLWQGQKHKIHKRDLSGTDIYG